MSNIPHNFKVWDVVCDFKRRHQYQSQANTGTKIERVLHNGDLILKDVYGIQKIWELCAEENSYA